MTSLDELYDRGKTLNSTKRTKLKLLLFKRDPKRYDIELCQTTELRCNRSFFFVLFLKGEQQRTHKSSVNTRIDKEGKEATPTRFDFA